MAFRAVNPEPVLVADSAKAAYPSALPAFLHRIAQANREFVVYDDGWRGWSYRYSDVDRMARALAARLRSEGIHKGDRVIIWSEGRAGWLAALWGCLLAGVVLVPVGKCRPDSVTRLPVLQRSSGVESARAKRAATLVML